MPTPTLIATAGAANANSFATLDEADAYHAAHLYASDWTGATVDQRTVALIQATREITARWAWEGWAVDSVQALPWPRTGLLTRNGWNLDRLTIPQELKDATAEYARQLIAENRSADSDVEKEGLESLRAGSVELTFRKNATAKPVPDAVIALIPTEWGRLRSASNGMRQLVRA